MSVLIDVALAVGNLHNPTHCTLQAESSENVLAEKEVELAEKNETRAQSHFLAREAVLAMCENRGKP